MNLLVLIGISVIVGLVLLIAIVWYLYMKARFKTVPSNEALIITGPNIGDPKLNRMFIKMMKVDI